MVYLAALASSALYGAADFLGGLASKRAGTAWVVSIAQATGLLVLLATIGFLPAADPTTSGRAVGCGSRTLRHARSGPAVPRPGHRHHGRRGAHHCRVRRGSTRSW